MAEYATKSVNVEEKTVTVTFGDGTSISSGKADYSPEMWDMLALHGLGQKKVDSYSGAKKAVEEGDATSKVAYAKDQVARVVENLKAGDWSVRGEGGPRVTILAQAVARALGITVEDAVEKLSEMDDATKKKVSAAPRVRKAATEIRLENERKRLAALEGAGEQSDDLDNLF